MIATFDHVVITTQRLELVPLRIADADEMVNVLADPALHEFTGGRPLTLAELRNRYTSFVQGSGSENELWLNWIVRRSESAVAVGTVQATVIRNGAHVLAMIAWIIGVQYQREGYAREAAVALIDRLLEEGTDVVEAHVHPDHVASAAVAAATGMRRTTDVVDGEIVWRRERA